MRQRIAMGAGLARVRQVKARGLLTFTARGELFSNVATGSMAALLVGGWLTGCGKDVDRPEPSGLPRAGRELIGNPDNKVAITNSKAEQADTWVYGAFPLCLDSTANTGSVELREITLLKPEGLELVDSGVKELPPGEDGIAGLPGPLPSGYVAISGLDFDIKCEEKAMPAEVALELRRTGGGSGTTTGFAIRYRGDAGERTVRYDAEITLCAGDEPRACREPE